MTLPNPFIELAQHPIQTLALFGYALGLAALVILTLGACWTNTLHLYARYQNNRPHKWEYIPPTGWLLRAASIPFVLMIDVWAVAALVWLATP